MDACRNEQDSKSVSIGEIQQQGIITIASCRPSERSYEIDDIRQGSFTYALLESLRIQGTGNCATVERLYQRLQYRVNEINRQYRKPRQTPYAIAEPASKYHLILLPQQATLADIETLKKDALSTEVNNNLAEDNFHSNYEGAATDGSAWVDNDNGSRILRGGSWFNIPVDCRCAFLNFDNPGFRNNNYGFRVVCAAPRTS